MLAGDPPFFFPFSPRTGKGAERDVMFLVFPFHAAHPPVSRGRCSHTTRAFFFFPFFFFVRKEARAVIIQPLRPLFFFSLLSSCSAVKREGHNSLFSSFSLFPPLWSRTKKRGVHKEKSNLMSFFFPSFFFFEPAARIAR